MGVLRKGLFVATGGVSGVAIKANSKKERAAKSLEKQTKIMQQQAAAEERALREQTAVLRRQAEAARLAAENERTQIARISESAGAGSHETDHNLRSETPPGRSQSAILDDLSKVAGLREQGVLPDHQFETMRTRLLAELALLEQQAAEDEARREHEATEIAAREVAEAKRLEAERSEAERSEKERQEKVAAEERAKQEQLVAVELAREREQAAKELAKAQRKAKLAKAASTLKSSLYDEELAKRLRDERQAASATTVGVLPQSIEQSPPTGEPPPPPKVGWYPVDGNPELQAYWDGQQWSAHTRWDGTAWVDVVPGG